MRLPPAEVMRTSFCEPPTSRKHVVSLFVATTKRIVFHEITQQAIKTAVENHTIINMNIVEAQQKVALRYFEDGSIEAAIPPLKILLHIMAYGHFEGKEISDPSLRAYFKRESILNSDWYKKRLVIKQQKDVVFYKKQIAYIEAYISDSNNITIVAELDLLNKLENVKKMYQEAVSKKYLENLIGTIGADPLYRK
mgnify:CR=1 FL=1